MMKRATGDQSVGRQPGGFKSRGAPTTIALMAIGGNFHHFFVRVTGVVKRTIKRTAKFHGARAALKGERLRRGFASPSISSYKFGRKRNAAKAAGFKKRRGAGRKGTEEQRKRRDRSREGCAEDPGKASFGRAMYNEAETGIESEMVNDTEKHDGWTRHGGRANARTVRLRRRPARP